MASWGILDLKTYKESLPDIIIIIIQNRKGLNWKKGKSEWTEGEIRRIQSSGGETGA